MGREEVRISIIEPPLIPLVVEPFVNDTKDRHLIALNRIEEPPTVRKVKLPEIFREFIAVFFRDQLFSNPDSCIWVFRKAFDSPTDSLEKLSVGVVPFDKRIKLCT
jgi:hypothetical protein